MVFKRFICGATCASRAGHACHMRVAECMNAFRVIRSRPARCWQCFVSCMTSKISPKNCLRRIGGWIPIDNNDVEQLMWQVATGRKNWLFLGSPDAGDRAAPLLTLISTALRHDLDVWAYLNDAILQPHSFDSSPAPPRQRQTTEHQVNDTPELKGRRDASTRRRWRASDPYAVAVRIPTIRSTIVCM